MTERDRELIVEEKLKHWKRIRAEVKDAEEEAANVAFSQGSGEPVQSSSISDKTARGAAVLDRVEEQARWIECIRDGLEWLRDEQPDLRRILIGHYGMRHNRGYKAKHAAAFTLEYCRCYHISVSEYKLRRREALHQIASLAVEYGLISNRREKNKVRPGCEKTVL